MAKRKRSWTAVKAELERLPPDELIRLVRDLCDRSPENRSFVDARLGVGDDPLTPFKNRIAAALCPDPVRGSALSVAAAKKAVSDYRQARGEARGMLDLMMYFVECGTEMTLDYGDMDEGFYSSLESMFDRVMEQLKSAPPDLVSAFLPRAVRIVDRAKGLGWGYYDYLADRLSDAFPEQGYTVFTAGRGAEKRVGTPRPLTCVGRRAPLLPGRARWSAC